MPEPLKPNRKSVTMYFSTWALLVTVALFSSASEPYDSFSIHHTRPVRVQKYLPTKIGTWWEYRETYKTKVGTETAVTEVQWTHRDTIVGAHTIPEGEFIEFDSTISDFAITGTPDEANRKWLATLPAQYRTHWLIQGNYIYDLPVGVWNAGTKTIEPGFAARIHKDVLTPDFFFPMEIGRMWAEPQRERDELEKARLFAEGKGPAPNPGMWFWIVEDRERVKVPAGDFPKTYRIVCRYNTGPVYVWFQTGIGMVKQKTTHAGTYRETETQLLRWKSGKTPATAAR